MKRIWQAALVAQVLVYCVIVAGSVVRVSKSGMGCPDWPRCFGQWIPPTSVEQLPEDYKETFTQKRIKKIERFTKLLASIGLKQEAEKIQNNKYVYIEREFNVANTWTEYVNRIFGFLSGLAVLYLSIVSLFMNWKIRILSIIALIILSFQAWLGSIVVASNLIPWLVTFHMIWSVLLLMILNWIMNQARDRDKPKVVRNTVQKKWLFVLFILYVVQLFYGIDVREVVDSMTEIEGYSISSLMNTSFAKLSALYIHRYISVGILLLSILFFMRYREEKELRTIRYELILYPLILFALGLILTYGQFPAFARVIHLFLALLVISRIHKLLCRTNNVANAVQSNSPSFFKSFE